MAIENPILNPQTNQDWAWTIGTGLALTAIPVALRLFGRQKAALATALLPLTFAATIAYAKGQGEQEITRENQPKGPQQEKSPSYRRTVQQIEGLTPPHEVMSSRADYLKDSLELNSEPLASKKEILEVYITLAYDLQTMWQEKQYVPALWGQVAAAQAYQENGGSWVPYWLDGFAPKEEYETEQGLYQFFQTCFSGATSFDQLNEQPDLANWIKAAEQQFRTLPEELHIEPFPFVSSPSANKGRSVQELLNLKQAPQGTTSIRVDELRFNSIATKVPHASPEERCQLFLTLARELKTMWDAGYVPASKLANAYDDGRGCWIPYWNGGYCKKTVEDTQEGWFENFKFYTLDESSLKAANAQPTLQKWIEVAEKL
ncbi:MAG: hypothetical protein AB7F31_01210 [Parachlamydiales bacterium]